MPPPPRQRKRRGGRRSTDPLDGRTATLRRDSRADTATAAVATEKQRMGLQKCGAGSIAAMSATCRRAAAARLAPLSGGPPPRVLALLLHLPAAPRSARGAALARERRRTQPVRASK